MAKRNARIPRAGTGARYEAESDLRTLKEAEMIQSDSKRFSVAKKIGAQEIAAIQKVTKPSRPKAKVTKAKS